MQRRTLGTDSTAAAELRMDALLGIRTTGRDESHASLDNNPYEPTPYAVLERLANSGLIGKRNFLVDYGCGKGRVGFYLFYQVRCRTVGIEYDELLHAAALRNRQTAAAAAKVAFELADASAYVPDVAADRFYFFNPFSAEVFARALAGIRASLDVRPRLFLLFLYYPAPEYDEVLEGAPWLRPAGEIDCRDLFDGDDPREKVLVFEGAPEG